VEESSEPGNFDGKHKMQEGYLKYSLCMNIFYRKSCQFTTQITVTW